ncbi:non-canonical purine NTP pyrophosphatase [Actinorhabdospora filicis]|uniref:non-canonical purine NTP pyrophosphatase n=1 Tax=Actinorhabdospora filicis TaxID=1785913 RepID=UPI002555F15E|nr:non-canonical purine NTP pyrophosphatase [Actinorhabdospora filicis]
MTGNDAKLAAAREALRGFDVRAVGVELDEIQSVDVREVAEHKARQAHRVLGGPVIVEDSGFSIDELGGFPGALAKPLLASAGARGVVALADLTRSRAARFTSVLVYIGPDGASRTFCDEGRPGTVSPVPIGAETPGVWAQLWRVFIPSGEHTTLAALDERERVRLLEGWRRESVFTLLGEWLAAVN